jgi:hypothetical protein
MAWHGMAWHGNGRKARLAAQNPNRRCAGTNPTQKPAALELIPGRLVVGRFPYSAADA